MISKEVQSEGMKKGRRRRRSARSRAAKRRARKMADRAGDISPVKCAVHVFLMKYQSALRKVPTQLPPKVHAGPPTKRVKRVSWREESGGGGGGDPAVLAVGPARRPLKYTRDELMRLRDSPLVRRDLENAFAGCDSLALVLKKRADSPNEEEKGGKQDAPQENHKGPYGRRSADPRERVRKESEPSGGIVLSPQRRSFTSGCGAPATAPQPPPPLARTRPDSPLSAQPQPAPLKTEQAGRRIGSGRIMVRDVPAGNWEEAEYRAEPYRRGNERYDRRSFGRDSYTSDIKREREDRFNNEKLRDSREDNNRRGGRFSQRRFEKEDEPEWFSGGPTSQLETIELRGFDEPVKKNGKDDRQNEKWNNNNGSRSPPERWRAEPEAAPTDTHLNVSDNKDSGMESKDEEGSQNNEQADFNLDEFLKPDAFPDVLTNGSSEAEGGSRFSRWFRRDSPPAPAGPPTGPPAPASDARHYERLLHDMLDDLDSSNIEPPMPEPTPMYPPPGHHGGPPHHPGHHQPQMRGTAAPTLLDLLRRARSDTDQRTEMNNGVGKIHSLEELEARLRPQQPPPAPAPTEHDLTAFKRLLAQVSGGHVVAAEPRPQQPPPMSLLQMLNKSMEQQQQQQQAKAPPQQPHIPQELLYKLLQVQQRQQQGPPPSEMPGPGGPPSGPAGPTQADRELLQRPEAQAIIHGLKAGEITVQHLMQQLGNPGLQNRHRELLLTIVRLHHHHQQQQQYQRQQQMGGSPLPGAPHLVVPPHHQPLRLSPLPHPGVPARIPSPRELAAHTQSIMQGALIKKKLEEQRENYRRRHEPQPHHKPTPISFTPTSVLRKMTADKESDAPSPKQQQQQWSQPPKMPQGRPIVKGNQSGILQMGYPQSQGDYQQHYLNQQQQQMSGNRAFALPQQRPPVNNSYNTMGSMGNMRGVAGSSALHQLLVHSHQRSLNEMAGGGGGDNQLARWFSPELLAQASAGKLPSVSHVPNALSLEDLERHHHSPAPPVRN